MHRQSVDVIVYEKRGGVNYMVTRHLNGATFASPQETEMAVTDPHTGAPLISGYVRVDNRNIDYTIGAASESRGNRRLVIGRTMLKRAQLQDIGLVSFQGEVVPFHYDVTPKGNTNIQVQGISHSGLYMLIGQDERGNRLDPRYFYIKQSLDECSQFYAETPQETTNASVSLEVVEIDRPWIIDAQHAASLRGQQQ